MYKVAICEDNNLHLNILLNYFDKYKDKHGYNFDIDTFESGEGFINQDFTKYEIIVLDIQMKEIDGIETAKIIRNKNSSSKIIFTTSFDKYSIEGYKVNAHRYLLKPIDESEFIESITTILRELEEKEVYVNINNKDEIVRLKVVDIYYIEIYNRKTCIHTKYNEYISKTSLNDWVYRLSKFGFALSHKSFLVNMNYIDSIEKDIIVLNNKKIVPVSKRKSKQFKDEFAKYIGKIF